MTTFAVVVAVYDTDLAASFLIRQVVEPAREANNYEEVTKDLGLNALAFRVPVFTLGEIMVLDGNGREVNGAGRKPSKWRVGIDTFDNIDEAVKRAIEVSA